MSLFKTSWIVLKLTAHKESELFIDVFSSDYGKLKLKAKKSKKEKMLDIGFLINFEVNVKKENSIHEIKNIKIKNEFDYIGKNYETIVNYLELTKLILEKAPQRSPVFEIFNILESINTFENITPEKIIFCELKILDILGQLPSEHQNPTIKKILSFISKESIDMILKLKGLSSEEIEMCKSLTKF